MKRVISRLRIAVRTIAVCLVGCSAAFLPGQMPQLPLQTPTRAVPVRVPVPVPPGNPQQPAPLTAADVTAFLDGFLPLQMQRDDVAGVTVGLFQDGQPLILKGYGFADWKKKIPVDPVSTTFRLASISKLFTYTAMMQQVEAGRLDLDTDVNRYLDFRIQPGPAGIGNAPITLRELATHTAGFEEELHDFGSDRSGRLPLPLRTFLIANQPHRFARPGTELAYSNYGVALIGYIVQRVSGEPYPEYIQRHIFGPLGMTHSSFVQPLPSGFPRSLGYLSTQKQDTGFEGFEEAPAGGLSSTAADMGRFGQMLLGSGAWNGVRVLQPASVALFFTPQFVAAPGVPPWNLGFYPHQRNGYTFTGHGGDLIAFHSQFWVEPTHRLVFLVSYNSRKAADVAREELFRALVDRYLPGPPPHPALARLTARQLRLYQGFYSSSRRADSTKLALLAAVSAHWVQAHKGGYLTISGATDLYGAPLHYIPVGNDTFFSADQQTALHFTRDPRGVVNGYVTPAHSDRLRGLRSPSFLRWSGLAVLFTMLLTLLAPASRQWQRSFQRTRPKPHPAAGTRWTPWTLQLAMLACAVVAVDAVMIVYRIANASSLFVMSHLDGWLRLQNGLTVVALVAIVSGLVSGLRVLFGPVRLITKLKITMVMLSCLWCAWLFVAFHLLGNATQY